MHKLNNYYMWQIINTRFFISKLKGIQRIHMHMTYICVYIRKGKGKAYKIKLGYINISLRVQIN